jgi:cytochrome b561
MDFSEKRITIESIHVTLGLSIFYLTLLRVIYKILNPTPPLQKGIFSGQKIIAKLNHIFLYISLITITISGALKKLYNGDELDLFFFNLEIEDNFELAEIFYDIHILSNYTLITLISLHISAVIIHKVLFKENLLKKIL